MASEEYKIEISQEAENDLLDIYEYIAFDLSEPEIAKRQLDQFKKAIDSLRTMPNRFAEIQNKYLSVKNIRKMTVNNFWIAYESNQKQKRVNILRVFYIRQDTEKLL